MQIEYILQYSISRQIEKGLPVKPGLHTHTGLCLFTVHNELSPQDPTHGSEHFSLLHARLGGHSEFIVHSGRQFGGFPM